jgi:hypothetical protein
LLTSVVLSPDGGLIKNEDALTAALAGAASAIGADARAARRSNAGIECKRGTSDLYLGRNKMEPKSKCQSVTESFVQFDLLTTGATENRSGAHSKC